MDDWRLHFPADAAEVKEIIYQQGLQGYFHINNLYISFESFELDALHYCYSTAFQEYKKFRDRYFNPDSMEYIDSSGMFVVYKTRELMEQAAVNGEQARIRKDYYRFMQKYDTYRFIKQDKHLLVDFDYAENARSPREYSELYWKMLGEEWVNGPSAEYSRRSAGMMNLSICRGNYQLSEGGTVVWLLL